MKKAAQKGANDNFDNLEKDKNVERINNHQNVLIVKLFLLFFMIILLIGVISVASAASTATSADVAYIYKSKAQVDENIVEVFEDLGLSVELIDETKLPSDFSSYKFMFIGDERLRNVEKLPIYDVPTIVTNYYFGEEFGLTDRDGISKLASNAPLSVRKGNKIIQVYTKATYNGISIPYYYLANENKVPEMESVAVTYTGNSFDLGDVISYVGSGTFLLNGESAGKNICFFGIVESSYWTDEARELFEDCIDFVGVACSSNLECPAQDYGSPYCYGDDVYSDTQVFECMNPGSFTSQCVDDIVKTLVKECEGTCQNGNCICRDQDNDSYDECDKGDEADDGKDKDCNEYDASVHPNALEICDNKDNDCDGAVDEDSNSCGSGNICVMGSCVKDCVDSDNDNYDNCSPGEKDDDGKSVDCNDNDNKVYPGASEICDGKDNDCDGIVDENNGMCEAGKICTQGQCVSVICDDDSDCGTDGFIDGKICQYGDVYQDYVDYSCKDPGTAGSYCDSTKTKKLVDDCTSGEICSNGMCVDECVDNDNDNYDNCDIGDEGDDGKDVDCNNNDNEIYPGALETCDGKDNDCDGVVDEGSDICGAGSSCVLGTCEQIRCSKDLDCGTDGFVDGLFCDGPSNNDVYQNYVDWTCENPGTISSSCSKEVTQKLVTDCSNACVDGACLSFICDEDSDCDDNNQYTKDNCNKPGTTLSYCTHEQIKCLSNNDCNDNDVSTKDSCVNPGTTNSYCVYEDIICSENSDCGSDGFVDGLFCSQSNDVYQNYRRWTCENPGTISSSCTQTVESKLVTDCSDKCVNGACVSFVCDEDSDCNDGNPETTDLCNKPGTVESYCTHDSVTCFKNSDCGTDRFIGALQCQEENLFRNFISFTCNKPGTEESYCISTVKSKFVHDCAYTCSDGNCVRCNTNNDCDDGKSTTVDSCKFGGTVYSYCKHETIQCMGDSNCGTDDYVGMPFCKNDDVYQHYRNWMCRNPGTTGSFCSYDESAVKIQDCLYGCANGKCISEVACDDDSDCGTDGFIDGKICQYGDVYQDYVDYSCKDPGTAGSYCDSTKTKKLVEYCDYDCQNGMCVDTPLIEIISPDDNDVVTDDDVLVVFNTDNWDVKGKGESHIHFHIDNVPGLSFNDHLMFYNGDDKIVELNLNSGETSFATWVNSNTIRINNVPDGEHTIRAHLATDEHAAPGNPEADTEISISVNTHECEDKDNDNYDNCDIGEQDDDGKIKDCNDNDALIYPGALDNACNGIDNDCDNLIDEDYTESGTSCGLGECLSSGLLQCVNGQEINGCSPGTPSAEICDNKDNDCDGVKDEESDLCDAGSVCLLGTCQQIRCSEDLDCGVNGYTGNNFCQGDDVYQNYKTYICNNRGTSLSFCSSDTEPKLKEQCDFSCSQGACVGECENDADCPSDYYSALYCTDKNVSKDFHDFACVSSVCKETVTTQTVEQCVDVCVNGSCGDIICYNDEDCGDDGFVGGKYCKSNDVYQDYKTYKCNNPGTTTSSCSSTTESKIVTECPYTCTNGQCTGGEICTDGIDNDGDGKIDGLVELNPNNGLTYVYPTNNPLWGYVNNPFELEYQVANISNYYNMGYNIYYTNNIGAIVRSWYTSPVPPYGGDYYYDTMDEVCYILGYSTVTGHDCNSAFGDGCGFSSSHDNFMWRLNGNDFTKMYSPYYKTWISRIWCKDKLPACSDGRDNDHDGKIDLLDSGCATENDDSEIAHDPECEI